MNFESQLWVDERHRFLVFEFQQGVLIIFGTMNSLGFRMNKKVQQKHWRKR